MAILETGIGLVSNMLKTKFQTTIEEDQAILADLDVGWRLYLAVTHRLNQKEILKSQEHLMTVLLKIIRKIHEANMGTSLLQIKAIKDSYMDPVEELGETLNTKEGVQLMILNRLRFRMYLKELHIYT